MKLLMWYCTEFGYNPALKTLDNADENPTGKTIKDALVAFVHVEQKDEGDLIGREKKLTNSIKWAARKNNANTIILHSFAHLSESKANPEYSKQILDACEKRLQNADYLVLQTPYGYFLDLRMEAPGHTFARLFRDL